MNAKRGEARDFFDFALAYDGTECLIWPFATVKGYGVMRVDGETVYVCRELLGTPPDEKSIAAHSCGRGQHGCVAKRHVRWTTQKDNIADTLAHGTRNRGVRNGQAKLTAADVLAIRASRKTAPALAAEFGVSHWTIKDIRKRRIWAWLEQGE